MANSRMALAAKIEELPAKDPQGSALGGPAWRPDTTIGWPTDRRGVVMMHLARVNCAELPSFEEFPRSGILQIFISTVSIGLGAGEGHGKGFVVEYWPDPKGGLSVPQPELDEDNFEGTPLMGGTPENTLHDNGRPLTFTAVEMVKDAEGSERPEVWLGGWPLNVQERVAEGKDIVLLQIGNGELGDNEFMWGGDIGAATFLISPADLSARRFDQTSYFASGY